MNLIIPLGGKSTRFGVNRPKWLLTHPDGSYMLEKAITCMDPTRFDRIILVITQEVIEHFELPDLNELVMRVFQDYSWATKIMTITVGGKSSSQLETVARGLEQFNAFGPVMVKDCDNEFTVSYLGFASKVCGLRIYPTDDIRRLQQKCFIKSSHNRVNELLEKQVCSDEFCVGGYLFASAQLITQAYGAIGGGYMSDAINWLIIKMGEEFIVESVSDYQDWGTINEWRAYCDQFANLLIDIDGVLLANGSRALEPRWGNQAPLTKNLDALRSLPTHRVKIIFVTARPESMRALTIRQLTELGLRVDHLVMGLFHAKRTLVNDHGGATMSYPSATALSVLRDSNELAEKLSGLLKIGDF